MDIITFREISTYLLILIILVLTFCFYKAYKKNKEQKKNYKDKVDAINKNHDDEINKHIKTHQTLLNNKSTEYANKLSKLTQTYQNILDEYKEEIGEYKNKVKEVTANDGEAFVKHIIDSCIKKYNWEETPQIFHNVIFKKKGLQEFRQIDHLIISKYGFFAVETKYYYGTSYVGIGHKNCPETKNFMNVFPHIFGKDKFGNPQSSVFTFDFSSVISVRKYEDSKEDKYKNINYTVRKHSPIFQLKTAVEELYKYLNISEEIEAFKVAMIVPDKLNYITNDKKEKTSLIDCREHIEREEKSKNSFYAISKEELEENIIDFLNGELCEKQLTKKQVQEYAYKLGG